MGTFRLDRRMRKPFILLNLCVILMCLFFIYSSSFKRRRYHLATKNNQKPPEIRPVPVIHGRKTNISKHPDFDSTLAIIEVISERNKIEDYRTAIGSVQCYANMYGHYMYLLDLEDFDLVCGHHKDFFYRRHCAIATVLEHTDHQWYVFLDSDMEVVNEKKTFYEYIDPKFDVFLYDRFWNWEIMAGSYIIKGSKFGREFVRGFANFEFEHPKIEHHGTDNGAIQAYVAEIVLNGRDKIHECWEIWKKSKGWDDTFDHEWCVRKAMGAGEEFEKVKVFRKGTAWARDGGLTNGQWSEEYDFIFHGRKELNKKEWKGRLEGYWFDTRTQILDLKECETGTVVWHKRPELIVNKTEVVRHLKDAARGIHSFLEAVYKRINKTDIIHDDFEKNKDVVDRFSVFDA